MKKMILLVSLILAVPAVSIACPGGGDGKRGSHFQMMDSNGDGVVSADEHAAMAAERFAAMDTNGDGKVSSDEMDAHRSEMKKKWKKGDKSCDMKGERGKKDGKGKGRMDNRDS